MTMSGRNFRRSRATVHINSKLENRLLGYITAASAAGVGLLLAVSQSVEAKIVYTPMANVPLTSLTTIDLNGDGIADLSFKAYGSLNGAFQLVYPGAGGSIIFGAVNSNLGPLPLPWLTRIGWKSPFQQGGGVITGIVCHTSCFYFGLWQNQTNKYLGIKFLINGKTHFGWMRLTVGGPLTGYATGYAYEDRADQPILAGKTSGPDVETRVAPAALPVKPAQTLGMLARGVDAVAIWRKEEEAIAS